MVFASGAHALILEQLVHMANVLPPGTWWLGLGLKPAITPIVAAFSCGLTISIPLVFSSMLIEIIGACTTRSQPNISIYFMLLPVKFLVGIYLWYWMLDGYAPQVMHIVCTMMHLWQGWLV